MPKRYSTGETEKLSDEPFCAHCRKPVDEWKVSIESDAWGEYDDVRRCPHCGEKCLEDQSTGLFLLVFFGVMFGSVPVWLTIIPDAADWVQWLAGLLAGIACALLAVALAKKWRLRGLKRDPE